MVPAALREAPRYGRGRALPFSQSAEMGERRAVLHPPPSSQSLLGQQKQAGGSKHGLNFSKTKPSAAETEPSGLGKEDPKSVLLFVQQSGDRKADSIFPPFPFELILFQGFFPFNF